MADNLSINIRANIGSAQGDLQTLRRELERVATAAGKVSSGSRFENLDPKFIKESIVEIDRLNERLNRLWTTRRGQAWQRRAREYGMDPKAPWDWDMLKMYGGNRSVATYHARQLYEDVTGAKPPSNFQPTAQQQTTSSSVSDDARSSFLARIGKGIGRLAIRGGVAATGVAVKYGWDAYRARTEANESVEDLWKRLGSEGFDHLLTRIRELGGAMQMTTAEAGRLAASFSKTSGAVDADVVTRARFAGQFARGFGIGPDEGAQLMGRTEYLGVGANRESQRQFAVMIGDTIAKGGMYGNPTQVFQDLTNAIQAFENQTSRVPSQDVLERFASLRAEMYTNPATRGAVGEKELGGLQGLLRGGNMINEAFLMRAFRGQYGDDFTKFQYLKGANMFQTPFEAIGMGSNTQMIAQFMLAQVKREAKSIPGIASLEEKAASILSGYTGNQLTPQNAGDLIKVFQSKSSAGQFKDWLKSRGVDLSKINDYGVMADLAGLSSGRFSPEEMKKKYLESGLMGGRDKDTLAKLTGAELAQQLPAIISRSIPTNPAQEMRSLPAEISRELEKGFGGTLVDVMKEIRELEIRAIHAAENGLKNLKADTEKISSFAERSMSFLEALAKKFTDMFGGDSGNGRYMPGAETPLPTGAQSRAKLMKRLLQESGITNVQEQAAIIGNAWQESAGLNPAAQSGDGGFGLFQWTGVRKKQLFDFLDKKGLSHDDFGGQMKFFLQEYLADKKSRGAVVGAGTVEEKTRQFRKHFERPKAGKEHDDVRIRRALEVMNMGKNSGVTSYLRNFLPTGKSESAVENLDPEFARRIAGLLEDMPENLRHKVKIASGYRSYAEQQVLFDRAVRKYGSVATARKHVAPPGNSMHNMGKAIDWDYFPGARDWIHKNAEKHGLRFRMNWEDWHIEPVEGRGALSPQIPDDADAAVRLNTMPGVPNARFDGQIELNIREQDQRGKTIRQQAHVLKAEPKIAGTPGKSQRWTVPYGIHGSW